MATWTRSANLSLQTASAMASENFDNFQLWTEIEKKEKKANTDLASNDLNLHETYTLHFLFIPLFHKWYFYAVIR